MKFAPALGRQRARPPRTKAAAVTPKIAAGAGAGGGRFAFTPSRLTAEKAVDEGMLRSVALFRGLVAIANNQAKLSMVVRQDDRNDGEEVEDHPLLPLLNAKPNAYESAVQFRRRLSLLTFVAPDGAFVEVVRSVLGTPLELHLPHPDSIRPVLSERDGSLDHFEVRQGAVVVDELAPENVLWIRDPHPLSPWKGITPLQPAAVALDVDWYAKLFQRAFLRNDGRLGGMVSIKGEVDPRDAAAIESRITGGYGEAGRWVVLEADGIDVAEMSATPRDAQYTEQRQQTKTETLMAVGTPESVAGNASERTYANADAEKENFWEETMDAHLTLLGSGLDPLDADPSHFITFDVSSVSALQRHKMLREDRDAQRVKDGLMTIDEWRERHGLPPLEQPGTNTVYIPVNVAPAGVDSAFLGLVSKPQAVPTPPTPLPTPAGATAPPGAAAGAGAQAVAG